MSPSEKGIISQFNSNNKISKDNKISNDNKKLKRNSKNIINDNNIENNENFNEKKNKKKKRESKINNKILINNVILLGKSKNNNLNSLQTEGLDKKNNINEIEENKNNAFGFNFININLNKKQKYIPKNSLVILNNYTFEEAIEYDMRSICEIFYIFLLSKQAIFHAFLYRSPLELFPLRLCLLIFITSCDLAFNAFFYMDDIISKKYKYARNLFLFTFNNNITIILLSTFIGFLFMTFFTNLSNSINNIRDIFIKEEQKLKKDKKYKVTNKRKKEILSEIEKILKKHKIKVIVLIIIELLVMIFFWYYITAFCHVYQSTQLSWLLDSFLSMLTRLIIIALLSLLFAKLYRIAIESSSYCIYKIVLFFYSFA